MFGTAWWPEAKGKSRDTPTARGIWPTAVGWASWAMVDNGQWRGKFPPSYKSWHSEGSMVEPMVSAGCMVHPQRFDELYNMAHVNHSWIINGSLILLVWRFFSKIDRLLATGFLTTTLTNFCMIIESLIILNHHFNHYFSIINHMQLLLTLIFNHYIHHNWTNISSLFYHNLAIV